MANYVISERLNWSSWDCQMSIIPIYLLIQLAYINAGVSLLWCHDSLYSTFASLLSDTVLFVNIHSLGIVFRRYFGGGS